MKIHIVKQGDTLYALSQKYGVPLQKIIEANPQLSNPDVLVIGEKIKIPAAPVPVPDNSDVFYKHTVKQGDTLWKLSKAWGITLKEIIDANPQLKNPNVLMIGEVVNIPKKGTVPPVQSGNLQASVVDKTQLGGKTYTGPIEQPPGKTSTAPITQPPAKTDTAPIEQPPKAVSPVNTAVKPVEKAPVQEMVHSETQSLFVQISVPAQKAEAHYEMPAAVQPYTYGCEPTAGYPGLTENANFYDCPPAYPLYEAMSNQPMNAPMNQVQPLAYGPENTMPYFYAGNMYPMAENPAWYPNTAPNYADTPVAGIHSNNASPQYGEQMPNLPWPTNCGCGAGNQVLPYQNNAYNMPMYTMPMQNMPMYDMPVHTMHMQNVPVYNPQPMLANQAVAPYGTGMPNVGPQYTAPLAANIPPNPEYPGLGNENTGYYSRITDLQQTVNTEQNLQSDETASPASGGPVEAKAGKTGSTAASRTKKVKTSGHIDKQIKSDTAKAQSKKSKGSVVPKKRRNPWISN